MKVHSLTTGEFSESKPPRVGIDKTPSLINQAESNGWTAGEFSFGKAEEGAHHFNPTIVERPDGLWLIIRRAVFNNPQDKFGMNSCWAFKLIPDSLKPEVGYRLKFPEGTSGLEQFEDPRAVFQNGKTFVACVNFIWYGNGEWTGAHQVLGVFDDEWNCTQMVRPKIGGNSLNVEEKGAKHEKNWIWWFVGNQIHVLYHSKPWRIAAIGKTFEDSTPYESEGIAVNYGEIRGGTPPVLVDDLYWTFFHSSVPWVDRFRRYHMGAVAFESQPPFKPVLITPTPLLTGSQNDYWLPSKPLVVFPGGALFKDGQWLIVYGINDLRCGYVRIPHADILKRAKLIDELSPSELICNPSAVPALADSKTPKGYGKARESANVSVVTSEEDRSRKRSQSNQSRGGTRIYKKEGDASCRTTTAAKTQEQSLESNGATKSDPEIAPTLGDQIREHIRALKEIEAGIPSRRARMLDLMRREKLIPQARRR